MPRLPIPQSTPKLPQKIFTPESQGADVARARGQFGAVVAQGGQQLGRQLQERQTQGEISRLNAELAKAQSELTVAWQETLRTADPNDPDVAKNFREQVVAQRVEAIRDFASTREAKAYFDRASAGLTGGFLVSTEQGQQSLREAAIVQDWEVFKNQLGDSVTADPSSFDITLQVAEAQVIALGQTMQLDAGGRAKLLVDVRNSLSMDAATAVIMAHPDFGAAEVQTGRFSKFLSGRQKAGLLDLARTQKKAMQAAAEKAAEDRRDAAYSDVISAAFPRGELEAVNPEDLMQIVAQDPRFRGDPAGQRAMLGALRAMLDDTSDEDRENFHFSNTLGAIRRGEVTSRTQILDLVEKGRFKMARARDLFDVLDGEATSEGQLRNQVFDDFRRQARAVFVRENAMLGIKDPAGERRFTEFMAGVTAEQRRRTEAGERGFESEAFLKDMQARLDAARPSSATLLRERIEAIDELGSLNEPPQADPKSSTKRLPGETVDQWRKRTSQ